MSTTKTLNLLTLLSAAGAIYFDFTGKTNLFSLFKPLTTILIISISLLNQSKKVKKYSRLIIIALIFCLIGDIFLLNENYFVFGLASFLIAHIIFTFSFISIDRWKNYSMPLFALIVVGFCYYLFLYQHLNELAIPVLLYFIFIILMCWQGISLFIWRKEFVFKLIAISVILFLVSDSIIALDKFKTPFEFSGILVLATYWVSISLLANSGTKIDKIHLK